MAILSAESMLKGVCHLPTNTHSIFLGEEVAVFTFRRNKFCPDLK